MQNNTYDAILRMILKNIKTNNVGGYGSLNTGIISSGNAPSPDFSDPYYLVTLDNFDYQLLYDSEDTLTGFTSNKGTWNWIFGLDAYEELTYVLVENPYTQFMIALIFENYDIRIGDQQTDEKGNLIEVVLIKTDPTVIPVDPDTSLYPILSISPESISIEPGDPIRYSVLLTVAFEEVVDVTSMCEWTTSSMDLSMEGTWEPGLIVNTFGLFGQYTITAKYNDDVVTATLVIGTTI